MTITHNRHLDNTLREHSGNSTFVFDIETGPWDRGVEQFRDPYPDFDPSSVKYGNLKDVERRKILLEEKKSQHEEKAQEHEDQKYKRAALNPLTGMCVAIGYYYPYSDMSGGGEGILQVDGVGEASEEEEIMLLERFWKRYSKTHNEMGHMIGHNIIFLKIIKIIFLRMLKTY